eukprot:7364784-Ditylum_brightwellii.AAC.1
MTQVSREAATDNINARLTSLEDFVGGKYGNAVGVDYPSVTIALNKTVSREAVQVMSDQWLNYKLQISTQLRGAVRYTHTESGNSGQFYCPSNQYVRSNARVDWLRKYGHGVRQQNISGRGQCACMDGD